MTAQILFTQQPNDQVVILRPDIVQFGIPQTLTEDFDGSNGGFAVETPIDYVGPWTYDATRGSWREDGQGPENFHANTSFLTGPAIIISEGGGLVVRFNHRYSFEYDGIRWDGGQLRMSLNGGSFRPVPAAAFIYNGYGGFTVDNRSVSALPRQPAFTGQSTNYNSEFITSVAVLGSFKTGDVVRIQFMASGDTNTRGLVPNWEIDRWEVIQGLDVRAASFEVGINDLRESGDPPATFQWYRDSGSGFQPLVGENTPQLLLAPVLGDNGARFRCEVSIPSITITSRTATLTVVYPNSPPTYTKGPDQSVAANSGLHTVTNWATNIRAYSDGWAPEVDQRLIFFSSADHLEYFSRQPKIDTNGTLTYTLAANACGTSIVTVLLQDSGGALGFGGDNRSSLETFRIDIPCPTNYCPGAANLSLTVQQNSFVDFQLPASDLDRDPLAYQVTQPPQRGQLFYSKADGTARYIPNPELCGSDSFRFNVTDGHCVSADATVTIRTSCCPYASNLSISIPVGSVPAILNLPGGDTDGDPVTYIVTEGAQHGVYVLGRQGLPNPFGELPPNQILYTPFANFFGIDTIRFKVSDGGCESSEAAVTINVVDSTPPVIYCPTDIVIEFTGTTGAVVNFSPYAADLSPPVVKCLPASGSAFSIGVTPVQCFATDASGNSNSCSFVITVLGARSVKQKVLAALPAVRNGINEVTNRARLDKVIKRLTSADDSSLWLDENYLNSKTGSRVFNLDRRSVRPMRTVARTEHDSAIDAELYDWIAQLIKTDRLLAALAVDAAEKISAESKTIAHYRKIILKGDASAAKGQAATAIADYRNAWQGAVRLHGRSVD